MIGPPNIFKGAVRRAVIVGQYRYLLEHRWGPGQIACFVMLNPSTATAEKDDATVRRCARFAYSWGYDGFAVVNLFALRSRDPKRLLDHADPVGPECNRYILEAVRGAAVVVCAWGASKHPPRDCRRDIELLDLLSHAGVRAHILRRTDRGDPAHPLFLPSSLRPMLWG